MIIKEVRKKQRTFDQVLKENETLFLENGDAMAYYKDHPEELWDKVIKDFEGSETKFKNWCHKNYLGARGPKGADQSKYDKAMAYFNSKNNETLNEGFNVQELLNMSFKNILAQNGGNLEKTLGDLNSIMTSIQGTDNTIERKAYFKAKNFHVKLVDFINNDKVNKTIKGKRK